MLFLIDNLLRECDCLTDYNSILNIPPSRPDFVWNFQKKKSKSENIYLLNFNCSSVFYYSIIF